MAQLNIYVARTERERFAEYAAQFGLDVTALSNLLLERELRVGRLATLRLQLQVGEGRTEKITAHMTAVRRAQFGDRAKQIGLSLSQAGAILVSSELQEKWLEKAVDNV